MNLKSFSQKFTNFFPKKKLNISFSLNFVTSIAKNQNVDGMYKHKYYVCFGMYINNRYKCFHNGRFVPMTTKYTQ